MKKLILFFLVPFSLLKADIVPVDTSQGIKFVKQNQDISILYSISKGNRSLAHKQILMKEEDTTEERIEKQILWLYYCYKFGTIEDVKYHLDFLDKILSVDD